MTSEGGHQKLILKYIALRHIFDEFQREENRATQALLLKFVIKFFGAFISLVLGYNAVLQLNSYFFIYSAILLSNLLFCKTLVKAYLTRSDDLEILLGGLPTKSFEKCIDELEFDENLKVLMKPLLQQKFSMRYDFWVKQPPAALDSMIFIVFMQFFLHFYTVNHDISLSATTIVVFLIFILASTALDYFTFCQWRENDFNPSEKKLKEEAEMINKLINERNFPVKKK